MIRVEREPEPADFEEAVRKKGAAFLKRCPAPTSKQFRGHAYWTAILKQLHTAYRGVCAYSCHWIPLDTGFKTVEHFNAKTQRPELAYEWSNYRLVCGALNGRKGAFADVLDPFAVQNGWFVIDFPSLLLRPAPGLAAARRLRIERTIARLRLNNETCVQARTKWVQDYAAGHFDDDFLQRHAPFISMELARQGLIRQDVRQMMT